MKILANILMSVKFDVLFDLYYDYRMYGFRVCNNKLYSKIRNLFFGKVNIKKYYYNNNKYEFKKDRPNISVIMPVYNSSKYLDLSIGSILNQTHRDFELIIVDDGSTDESKNIITKYQKKDSRIISLFQENKNAGIARNLGLEKAKGEYVIFLDSDDFFEANMLELAYKKAKKDKDDVCMFGAYMYDDKRNKRIKSENMLKIRYLPKEMPICAEKVKDYIFSISSPSAWNILFNKKYIDELGIKFMGLKVSNDLFFVEAVLSNARNISYIDIPLVNYRVNINTNLQSKNNENKFDFYEALMELKNYLVSKDKYDLYYNSFRNLALNICMYNYSCMKNTESRLEFKEKLLNEIFFELNINNIKINEVQLHNLKLYRRYKRLFY